MGVMEAEKILKQNSLLSITWKEGIMYVLEAIPQQIISLVVSRKRPLKKGKKGYLMAAVFYAADAIRSIVKYYRHLDNEVVIFSRYLLGVCYLPSMFVLFGYNLFATFLPTSKYSFYLDVTPEIALERISGRAEKAEMFETLPRLRKMQRKMRFVAHKKKWLVINGDRFPSKVWYQIRRNLKQLDSNT
jgi:dTMP kinase